ncbi:hypothetical protein JXQ31_02725 [candidate division KSB1 bacterium]|nr:hypothetical protein [candidate division KSB1 bacterium]
MNFFQYDFGDEGWGFVHVTNGCWFGLDSNQQLILGSSVVTKLARLMSIQEPGGKIVPFIISKPDAGWVINGLVPFTLHVLQNKDELRYRDQWLYFTSEDVPSLMNYNGGERKCPRCKDRLHKDDLVVQCPNPKCRLIYHESDDRKCWSYDSTCTCGHSTKMELSWKPDPNDAPKRK